MKVSDNPPKVVDEVIADVRAIKRAISERHCNDINRLLASLISQERASGIGKAEQCADGKPPGAPQPPRYRSNVLPDNNAMPHPEQIVADYVAMYHAGRKDDAFHGLLESGAGMIPELIAAYEATDDTNLRSFIIGVVSEYRDLDSSGFLRHALQRGVPLIWKRALDGLVMMGCAADLEHVLVGTSDEDKRAWIVEAIEQISVTQHTIEAEQGVPSDGHKPSSSASTAGPTAPADAH